MKNKKLLGGILGLGTVAALTGAAFLVSALTAFSPRSTGEHDLANHLYDTMDYVPLFADGSMYFLQEDGLHTVAENIYDPAGKDKALEAEYAVDTSGGRQAVYLEGESLYLYNGSESILLGSHVSSWRTVSGMEKVAFTVLRPDSNVLATLFLYENGSVRPVAADVKASVFAFSQDGSRLFALRPNTYPALRNTLLCVEADGTLRIVDDNCGDILWTSPAGDTVITGESADDSLYTYRVFYRDLKKCRQFDGVYLSHVSDDKSVAYLLADYDIDASRGELLALDLYSGRTLSVARDVSYINEEAVTDAAEGMVYSVCTDRSNGLYSILYSDLKGHTLTLVRNTYESTMDQVAINTKDRTGFLLVPGTTVDKNSLWRISWKGNTLETERVMTGYLESMIYYECTDSVLFVKNPAQSGCTLYRLERTGDPVLLTDDCGATYDSASGIYTARCVLSNDGRTVLYFSGVTVGDSLMQVSGTMKLLDVPSRTAVTVAENVSASFMSCPVTDGNMTRFYYCTVRGDDLFDLYAYGDGTSRLLREGVDGMVGLSD